MRLFGSCTFFILAATVTILVSGADGFAQDSFTGARSFSWLRRTHLSRPAKVEAESSRSTGSPTRDAQAVSLANLPVATDFDVHTVAVSSLPSAPERKVRPEVEPATLRSAARPFLPVGPATRPRETPKQGKICGPRAGRWLMATGRKQILSCGRSPIRMRFTPQRRQVRRSWIF